MKLTNSIPTVRDRTKFTKYSENARFLSKIVVSADKEEEEKKLCDCLIM